MMKQAKGVVDGMSASGGIWGGFEAPEVRTVVFDSLKSTRKTIQISIFSLGEKNEEVREFFNIIEDKLKAGRQVQFIINNLNGDLIGDYSKNKLNMLMKYENFDLQNFVPKKERDSLHAKIIVIDRKIALVGSANLTQHGMFSNYEIMLKVSGGVVGNITRMLDKLAIAIKNGEIL